MLQLFDFPKNDILSAFEIPIVASKGTKFILLPNQIILLHEKQWITLDQVSLNIINQFNIRNYIYKTINFSSHQGILAILENQPLELVSPSVYKTKIAKLNQIDGSVEKFIEITGFEEDENLIDICADERYIYILLEKDKKKKIKQFDISTKQMLLLTKNLNNRVQFDRIKLIDNRILLLDSLENAIYEVNKLNGRASLFKRQFPKEKIVDFDIKFNNLFVINQNTNKICQITLSQEFSHVALQTNVFDLATNGENQSLIRGTVYNEAEVFQPFQPLKIRTLKPLDLLTRYINGNYSTLTGPNTRGLLFIPLLEYTDDCLFMDPGSKWEIIFGDLFNIEQIRLKFAQFRPGDIKVDILLENNSWEELQSTPLPLLLTREDLVFDNFFEKTNVKISGIRVVNLTSNTLAFQRLMLLDIDSEVTEKNITNYAIDTGQTLFFVASPKTTINTILNPRFLQGKLYWKFKGRSELIDETLLSGDIGAFLHSTGDNTETYIEQKVILNQPYPKILTASLFVHPDITFINQSEQNCGIKLIITDTENNTEEYYQSFTPGNRGYERVKLQIVPPFPVYDVRYQIICQKDTVGTIEIDKIQLEQDKLHNFVDHEVPNIFIKAIHEF